jgi:hypothetical protein
MNISLLNSPLLSWDGILNSKKCKDVSKIIQAIYLQSNPGFKQYRSSFEQSNDYMSMCVLSLDVVNGIINKQSISNNGFESMHAIDEKTKLSLLFDMCLNSQFIINRFSFIMGNLEKKFQQKNKFS